MAIDLIRLRYFSTVVLRGSFRRAAEDLHVAQPALSRHVHLLEEELGIKLLTRTPRGVTPTEGGLVLLRQSQKLFELFGRLKAEVTSIASAPTGNIRIGVLPAFAVRFLAGAIAQLRVSYPGLTFEIAEGFSQRLQEQVLRDDLDMAVLAGLGPHPDLFSTPLYAEEVWLIGLSTQWTAPAKPVEPEYLAKYPLMCSQYLKPLAERAIGRKRLNLTVQVGGANVIGALITRGIALYLGPPTLFWEQLEAGLFSGTPVRGLSFQREVVRRKDRPETAGSILLLEKIANEVLEFSKIMRSPITLTTTKRWTRMANR